MEVTSSLGTLRLDAPGGPAEEEDHVESRHVRDDGLPEKVWPYHVTLPAWRISARPVSLSTPPLNGKSWSSGGRRRLSADMYG